MAHLGIDIPVNLRHLYNANYTKIAKAVKHQLHSMKSTAYSWMDRIHMLKTFILPRFLFLFRMLLLTIPNTDLQNWQRSLNNFLWSDRRHRISFQALRQSVRKGGMGIPDLYYYYVAANLVTIIRLNSQPELLNWLELELHGEQATSCDDLIWMDKVRTWRDPKDTNPFLSTTFSVWFKWRSKLVRCPSRAMLLTGHCWFPPDLDTVLRTWARAGLKTFGDAMKRGALMQKQELEQKVGTKIMWMHYFQLRAIWDGPKLKKELKKDPTPFECLLLQGDGSTKRKLSIIYRELLALDKTCMARTKKKWEEDCNVSYTEEEWSDLCASPMMTSSWIPLRLQTFKIFHHWYLTPQKLYLMDKKFSNICWKGYAQVASSIHCWWHCPVLQRFWSLIHSTLQGIFDMVLPFTPEAFLLNDWESPSQESAKQSATILLTLAKSEIASKWKSASAPSIEQWQEKIWKCYIMAKTTDKVLRDTCKRYRSKLERIWAPILTYLTEQNVLAPG